MSRPRTRPKMSAVRVELGVLVHEARELEAWLGHGPIIAGATSGVGFSWTTLMRSMKLASGSSLTVSCTR